MKWDKKKVGNLTKFQKTLKNNNKNRLHLLFLYLLGICFWDDLLAGNSLGCQPLIFMDAISSLSSRAVHHAPGDGALPGPQSQ